MHVYQIKAVCVCCGKLFPRSSPLKRYCSNACRQKAYRARVEDKQLAHFRFAQERVTRSRLRVTAAIDDVTDIPF